METYEQLHRALGKPERQIFPPQSILDKADADADLIELWRADGWARYGDGAFFTVNPTDFSDALKDWAIVDFAAVVFARSAFGDLFLLRGEDVLFLTVQRNRLLELGAGVYIFLNSTLKEPGLHESFLQTKLFGKVKKQLGVLEPNECYGVFPALPVGGDDEDVDSYKRVGLLEYLATLAQMHK